MVALAVCVALIAPAFYIYWYHFMNEYVAP
jgi:hypothetical protein